MARCVPLVTSDECDIEAIALAERVYIAALAEMGYDVSITKRLNGRNAVFTSVPEHLYYKAREVAYRSAGIPFRWVEDGMDLPPGSGWS